MRVLRSSSRSTRLGSAASLLVLVAVLGASERSAFAAPDSDPDADTLIARGIELREHGKDDDALAVFKRAYAKTPSPRARAQVALAEQALGLWVAAESDLLGALSAESDPWIAKNKAAIEGALAVVRRHIGSLEIRGTEGAEVMLDGVKLGTLPTTTPFRVEAGKRQLELHAKGFHPTTRSIEVPAGAVARETVSLVALGPDELAAGSGPSTTVGRGGDGDRGDPGRTQRVVGWAFVGTGAALLITGGIGLLVRKGIVEDYNNRCPGLGAAQPADCDNTIESARTWLTVSIVSLVAGGVFALGGVTLVATAPRREPGASGANGTTSATRRSGVRVGCAPSAVHAGAQLACVGSF